MRDESNGLDARPNRAGNRCRTCGAVVSERFAGVFGDNDDVVHRCLNCTTMSTLCDGGGALRDGDGARPDW